MGKVNNFGQINDVRTMVELPLQASVAFKYLGGKFVTIDGDEQVGLTADSEAYIVGWAMVGEFTGNSTAGRDKVAVNMARGAVYEMPIDTTLTETELKALLGKTCDIVVTSGIQYADHDAGDDNVIQIVGYHYYGAAAGEQTLLVRLWDPNITAYSVT